MGEWTHGRLETHGKWKQGESGHSDLPSPSGLLQVPNLLLLHNEFSWHQRYNGGQMSKLKNYIKQESYVNGEKS